jgi:hypothetical protein
MANNWCDSLEVEIVTPPAYATISLTGVEDHVNHQLTKMSSGSSAETT